MYTHIIVYMYMHCNYDVHVIIKYTIIMHMYTCAQLHPLYAYRCIPHSVYHNLYLRMHGQAFILFPYELCRPGGKWDRLLNSYEPLVRPLSLLMM